MIINYKQEDGRKCLAVVLPSCNNYAELQEVKAAIITGVKAIVTGDYNACSDEAYQLVNLLEEMELTEEQAKAVKL